MSNNNSRFVRDIKRRVIQKCGFPIRNKRDCGLLSEMILTTVGEAISITTIYRLFLEGNDGHKYYTSTLNILARFIDFKSWNDFYFDVLLNEDVSGISSQETFGRSEPSLIDFTIRSRSWLVLNEYFDSFINVNRQESFQTLGWSMYVALLRNPEVELEFYQKFAGHAIVRKTFFELAADPDNLLPRYRDALELYIQNIPKMPEAIQSRDYVFGYSLLIRFDFLKLQLDNVILNFEMYFNKEDIAEYFRNVEPVYPLARLAQAKWLYLYSKGMREDLNRFEIWWFKWTKRNWNNWDLTERKAVLYCAVEASMLTSMEDAFYPKVISQFSEFVAQIFGSRANPSCKLFLERTEFNGVRLQRMMRETL